MIKKKIRLVEQAKKIIDVLEKQNVVVKPQDLVNKSRSKHSPLHGYFVWDNSEAGEAYRRHQAGQLIARCKVYYKDGRKERSYQKVRVTVKYNGDEKEEEGYVSTARVLSDKDLRAQTIKNGLDELYRWKNKFSVYRELMKLINISKMEHLGIIIKPKQ